MKVSSLFRSSLCLRSTLVAVSFVAASTTVAAGSAQIIQ